MEENISSCSSHRKERQSLMDIFVQYADARTNDSSNQIMTWVKESIPNGAAITVMYDSNGKVLVDKVKAEK